MKTAKSILLFAALGTAACSQAPTLDPGIQVTDAQRQSTDAWFVNDQLQTQAAAAIVTQRTLYPYHFDTGTAHLTDLGRRDLATLADYYRSTPGALTLVKGDVSDELFAARSAAVRDALKDAGVNVEHVTIADGYPSGRGVSGQNIVNAVKNDKGQFSGSSTDTGSVTSEGVTNSAPADSSMKGTDK